MFAKSAIVVFGALRVKTVHVKKLIRIELHHEKTIKMYLAAAES